MKSSDHVQFQAGLYSKELTEGLIEYVKSLPKARWVHRDRINSIPTAGTSASDYWFLGDRQQPVELNEFLIAIAPVINGVKPSESIINHYDVGGGMPEHIDLGPYRVNMVVMLSDNSDGVEIDKVFHKDVPGTAVLFPLRSPPHRVPAVKHERFIIIYLYE